MKQVNMSKIINYLTILGLLILLSAFFLDNWIRDWLFLSSWGNVATTLILPLLGTLILILSIYYKIYTKNIRKILLSTVLVVLYFILFSLVTALSGLFQLNLYFLLYRMRTPVQNWSFLLRFAILKL